MTVNVSPVNFRFANLEVRYHRSICFRQIDPCLRLWIQEEPFVRVHDRDRLIQTATLRLSRCERLEPKAGVLADQESRPDVLIEDAATRICFHGRKAAAPNNMRCGRK